MQSFDVAFSIRQSKQVAIYLKLKLANKRRLRNKLTLGVGSPLIYSFAKKINIWQTMPTIQVYKHNSIHHKNDAALRYSIASSK